MTIAYSSLTVSVKSAWLYTNPTTPLNFTAPDDNSKTLFRTFTHGTGLNQVNRHYVAVYTILASATEDINLQSLTGPSFGESIVLTRVAHLTIVLLKTADILADGTAGTAATGIRIGANGTANEWTNLFGAAGDYLPLVNGGVFSLTQPTATGIAVASNNRLLRLTNTDGATAAKVYVEIEGSQ